ncbi:MFS transporter [Leucobacter insecticola]|uniref:MFS transporter n=1 Tax=Leucobacter insecticola TaxID=2714934 RepID=A0A6G8FG45_9MICO|nr:MFS transporter [Leucobacter insecticola]QIM15305.1 MFS transporter [Leucobacter insecticola]
MSTTLTPQVKKSTAPRSQSRTVFATSVGNALEWFDWQIYATFAPFIAMKLFDSNSPVSSLLQTFAVFAVGFLARPLGGLLFGLISDRRGRKASLILAVLAASLGSLLIGLTPSHAAIGAWAAVLLLIARLVQGLAHGGEMPAAQTYLSEIAAPNKRGLWSSLIYVSGTTGILCASLFGAVLIGLISPSEMEDWGWRIPFFLAAAFGLFVLVMRVGMKESDTFETGKIQTLTGARPAPLMSAGRAAMLVILLTIGATVSFYVWGVTAPAVAIATLEMDAGGALWAGSGGIILFIAVLPLWGRLADRIGRKPVLTISLLGTAAAYFPMQRMMTDQPWTLFVSTAVVLMLLAGTMSILPAVFAELFPTHIRTVGTAVPYSIAVALFGGTAPYLQTWFGAQLGQPWMFSLYAVVLLSISAATAVFLLPETKARSL